MYLGISGIYIYAKIYYTKIEVMYCMYVPTEMNNQHTIGIKRYSALNQIKQKV